MARSASSLKLATGVTPAIRDRLVAASRMVHYEAGEIIQLRGDLSPGLSIILSGAVRLGNRGRDGRYRQNSVLGPGATFGTQTLFADLPRANDAEAATPAKLAHLSRGAYQRLAEKDKEVEAAVQADLAFRFHAALEMLDEALRLSTRARIARMLLAMTRSATKKKSAVHITQTDLADMLGVTRLSVSNNLKALEHDHLIRRGYGEISVLNRPGLKKFVAKESQLAPLF